MWVERYILFSNIYVPCSFLLKIMDFFVCYRRILSTSGSFDIFNKLFMITNTSFKYMHEIHLTNSFFFFYGQIALFCFIKVKGRLKPEAKQKIFSILRFYFLGPSYFLSIICITISEWKKV